MVVLFSERSLKAGVGTLAQEKKRLARTRWIRRAAADNPARRGRAPIRVPLPACFQSGPADLLSD